MRASHPTTPSFAHSRRCRLVRLALATGLVCLAPAAAPLAAHQTMGEAAAQTAEMPPQELGAEMLDVSGEPQTIEIPPEDLGVKMLDVMEYGQKLAAERWGTVHDFQFEDRLEASGIAFRHLIVDDAGKSWKPAHYDHGNGVAVADVDGDGHPDLYFLTQIGRNELWRNRGDGTFEDWTDRSGLALADEISVTAAFGDIDNDGDADLYVTTVRMGNHLFVNDGDGRFEDSTEVAGLTLSAHSSGAVFFDYDRDGHLDLFVTNVGVYTNEERGEGGYYRALGDAFMGHNFPERTEYSRLYRNRGDGTFSEVTEQVGLAEGGWNGDATFTDFNADGYPDLFVLNMQGDDRYYENQAGERFVDRTDEVFEKTPWGTMGVKFFDYDNDGRQDLILTDMHSDMAKNVTPGLEKIKSVPRLPEAIMPGIDNNVLGNAFYRNRGDGTFEEVSDLVGAENYWPWGVSVGDLNADGFEDVFIASSMNYPFRYGCNTVLLNDRGEGFRDSEFVLGVEPRKGPLKKPWFELDCDGADSGHKHCQGKAGRLTVMGSVGSRTSAILDIEGDGDLDIVTGEFNDVPQLLVNNLADSRPVSSIQVELVGTRSNRDGLGALVTVRTADGSYSRYHDGKSGYLSQSSMPLYFGLGDATAIEAVEVAWPSGHRQTVTEGLAIGGTIEIVEDAEQRVAQSGGK